LREDDFFQDPIAAVPVEGEPGKYVIHGIPSGREYYLRYEFYGGVGDPSNRTSQFLVTRDRAVDLSESRVGNPDWQPAENASLVFNVDNMESWQPWDSLAVLASDSLEFEDTAASGRPVTGATSLRDLSYDWSGKPLMGQAGVEGVRLLHRRVERLHSGLKTQLVGKVFEAAIAQVNGTQTVVEGSFSSIPPTMPYDVTWAPEEFLAAASATADAPLRLVGSRLSILDGYAGGVELFSIADTGAELRGEQGVFVSDPFHFVRLRRRAEIQVKLDSGVEDAAAPPLDEELSMSVEEDWPRAGASAIPLLHPPDELRVNDQAFDEAPSSISFFVTWYRPVSVSWTGAQVECPEPDGPPLDGESLGPSCTPTLYRVRMYRLVDDRGVVGRERVMTLVTSSTTFTVPPGVLRPNSHYFLKITAEYEPGLTASRPLLIGRAVPRAVAETVTGLFSTFRRPSATSSAPELPPPDWPEQRLEP
jgi:hypothetical protein